MIDGGIWRSRKGTLARVICSARAEDTGPRMVVWQDIGTGSVYYTPAEEWSALDDAGEPRFRRHG